MPSAIAVTLIAVLVISHNAQKIPETGAMPVRLFLRVKDTMLSDQSHAPWLFS